MANIALVMYPAQGHINGTFYLAKSLRARGHTVRYYGVEDFASVVEVEGLEFSPVARAIFPRGSLARLQAELWTARGLRRLAVLRAELHSKSVALDALTRELPPLFERDRIDLALVDVDLLSEVALALYGASRTRIAMINTMLPLRPDDLAPPLTSELAPTDGASGRVRNRMAWGGVRLRTTGRHVLASLLGQHERGLLHARHLRRRAIRSGYPPERMTLSLFGLHLHDLPELVLCPRVFDLPRADDTGLLYGDAGVDLGRTEAPCDVLARLDERPLVYCSVGTQVDASMPSVQRFLGSVVAAFARRPDRQLLVTTGARVDPAELGVVPENVRVVRVAPQLAVLRRAAAMITHGGLNTVKECILSGVPMVVYPFQTDQPGNAVRVAYHRLGRHGRVRDASAEDVTANVDAVLQDPELRRNISAMQDAFRSAQAQQQSARHVEALADPGR